MSDLISIIIPVYNVEDYIEECLESILKQTYKNIEILLIDDGSTDKSGKICDIYEKKDNRIKVIHQNNSGLSSSRNNGIKIARGNYLSFVDADDVIHSKMLEILYHEITTNDCDIAICKYQHFSDKYIETLKDYKVNIMNQNEFIENLMIDKEISSHACNKLYRKKLFKNIKYPISKKYEDIGTTYRLGLQSKKIVYLNIELYGYRIRDNSITKNFKKENLLDYIEMVNLRYNELLKIKPDLKDYIDMNKINTVTTYFKEIFRNNKNSLLDDLDIKVILENELSLSEKLIRKETKKLTTFRENIENKLLIFSPKLFFYIMKIHHILKHTTNGG